MAYDSTLWESGDVITAEKLNKMENQVAPLIGVLYRGDGFLQNLNLSYKDIHDAVLSGRNIVIYSGGYNDYNDEEQIYPGFEISCFSADNSGFWVYIWDGYENITMNALSETDPLIEEQALY